MSRCSLRHLFSMPLGHTMEACSEQHSYMNTVIKGAVFRRGDVFFGWNIFVHLSTKIKFSSHRMQVVNHQPPPHITSRFPLLYLLAANPKTCPSPSRPALSQRGRWTISLKIPHLRCQNQSQSKRYCGDSPSLVSVPTWEQAELNVTWGTMDRGDANVYSVTLSVW